MTYSAKYWFGSVSTDAILVVLIYLWQAYDVNQAGSVAVFWIWFFVIVKIISGATADKNVFSKNPRHFGFVWYHAVTEIALVSTLVWIGYVWLASFYLLGSLMVEMAREREPKGGDK